MSRWCDQSIYDAGHSDGSNDLLYGRSAVWNLRRRNHLGQRSCVSASIGRTYGRKRPDQMYRKSLAGKGPSTYGAMSAGTSTISPRAVWRRSPPRRWSASPRSIGSRRKSAAATPRRVAPHARQAADRSLTNCVAGSRRRLRSCGQCADRRGNRLCAQSLARAHAVPRGRPNRDRLQLCRTKHAPDCSQQEKLAVRGQRRRGEKLGCHGIADRDVQAEPR